MTKWLWTIAVIVSAASPSFGDAKLADVCDLLRHPARYQGKDVRVRGSNGVKCPSGGELWVDSENGFGIFIGPYSPMRSKVGMIVSGTFHWDAGKQDPYTVKARSIDRMVEEKSTNP
jgi:hypothetical protein